MAIQLILLALLSSIALFFGWPNYGFFPLLFVGLVPLFWGVDRIAQSEMNRWQKVGVAFLFFFCSHGAWIALSSQWLQVTSPKTWMIGFTLSGMTNAVFLCLTVLFVDVDRRPFRSMLIIVCAWILMEFFNQHWMVGSPYFTLGSGFGMFPQLIQFYKVVGVEGGTIWVLLSNGLVFLALRNAWQKGARFRYVAPALLTVIVPILVSCAMWAMRKMPTESLVRVGVLHTHFDPYQEKYASDGAQAVAFLAQQSAAVKQQKLDLLIWPETAISNIGWATNLPGERTVQYLSAWRDSFPTMTITTGGYAFSAEEADAANPYARKGQGGSFYYETHNVSLTISNNRRMFLRSKEKFVPFQERIPFLEIFPWLVDFADYVGSNTMVSRKDDTEQVHTFSSGKYSFTPVLCYESIYPLFMARHAKHNHLHVVHANEFWNKNPYGSRQYLYNSVTMAIQANIPLLRSSNNGISAIIHSDGSMVTQAKASHSALLSETISLGNTGGVYTSIAGYSVVLSVLGLVYFLLVSRQSVKK